MLPNFTVLMPMETCTSWLKVHKHMQSLYWSFSVTALILCGINILTNGLAFIIFSSKEIRNRSGGSGGNSTQLIRLLTTLSALEVLFQALFSGYVVIEKYLLLTGSITATSPDRLRVYGVLYLCILIPLLTSVHIARNWMIVLISLYRFEKLARAFSRNCLVFRTEQRVGQIMCATLLLSVIIGLPRIIERNIMVCQQPDGLYYMLAMSSWGQTMHWFRYGYSIAAMFLFQNGGPILIICVVSTLLVHELRRRHRIHWRLKNPNASYAKNTELKEQQKNLLTPSSHNPPTIIMTESKCDEIADEDNKNNSVSPSTELLKKHSVSDGVHEQQQQHQEERKNKSVSEQLQPQQTGNARFSVRSLSHTFSNIKLRSSNTTTQNCNSSDGTRLVMILCISFVVCEAPIFFSKLLYCIIKVLPKSWEQFLEYLSEAANCATIIDSFLNFFVYLLSNVNFRQALKAKFQFKCH